MLAWQVCLDLITLSTPSARSRPWDKGGRGGVPPNFFSALLASVWSKNKGGPPLDLPLNTNIEEEEGQQSTSILEIVMTAAVDFFLIIFLNNYACEMKREFDVISHHE